MSTTIYHNPKCGTSRNVLGLIRNAGIEPTVIEYLKTPPDHAALRALLQQLQLPARASCAKRAPQLPNSIWATRSGARKN